MATQDNSIIPITSHIVSGLEEQCVNARDLHHFLDVGRDFSNWVKARIEEYQFVEGQDFIVCSPKRATKQRGGSNRLDYFLTLEMGKELSMIENNDKGRKVRRYFIECERRAKQPRVDPEFLMIHKSVLDNTGKALVWMGDYGVTSQPYYGGTGQPLMVDGRPQLQDSITIPMDDWIDVCDSVVALSKIFGEALSRSIQNNYAPLPLTVQVPTTLASKVSHSTSMIYTHTFRHVKSR
jgi:phage anti-repressor protein